MRLTFDNVQTFIYIDKIQVHLLCCAWCCDDSDKAQGATLAMALLTLVTPWCAPRPPGSDGHPSWRTLGLELLLLSAAVSALNTSRRSTRASGEYNWSFHTTLHADRIELCLLGRCRSRLSEIQLRDPVNAFVPDMHYSKW